jgi:hypothetical protein
MRTSENAVLSWDDQTAISSPAEAAHDIDAPESAAEEARSSFWQRAAVLFTIFLCFQFALLACFGL